MNMQADLHVHTTASDGALSPSEVVHIAAEQNLAAIAITDHDTVDGIDEALTAGSVLGVEVVPGVEISTMHPNGVEVHVLGYCFNHHDSKLQEKMRSLMSFRIERGRKMVELLNDIGIPVTFDRVLEIAGGGAVGRPHVARALVEIGAVSGLDVAFGKYLAEGCPAFVPRFKVSPAEAIQLINNAGGVAGCAHVAKLKRDDILTQLIEEGMRAIEVYHPDHGSVCRKFYRRFAEKRGLIATGGSDAHCYENGTCVGAVTVDYEVVGELREASLRVS